MKNQNEILNKEAVDPHMIPDQKTNPGEWTAPPTLTPQEAQLSYASYFNRTMIKPDQALVSRVEAGPLDPDIALKNEHLNDLLKPGYLASECGYTQMTDGTGYVSSIVQMPDVTAEMLDWWFAWHPLEPVRYKIWDPLAHYSVSVSPQDRRRLTNPAIPCNERLWGTTHHVVEDVGSGIEEIAISFVSPAEFGFDMQQYEASGTGTAICAKGFANMVHIFRPTATGAELRTRFWFTPKARVPLAFLKGLNLHALEEYSNLAGFLPELYAEFS
ncbi:hypothetical protein VA7868_01450 [Vibrio aerogenes CECT 7868]|uniref:DAPG hydrolase PhiG domain-containing protein n=1 Tax=Vibrio aerogenes CECT 7868 TaxID=1216006 RepID=A0A1M5Y2D8_9VIBR|nr:hypothetical protein [Vibrio aerogenes]SHI06172.1 hypothetical protein VA7868_01450 [Vibrio aerogenes CECT 7868]